MSNSYSRFQNTLNDLQDCYKNLHDYDLSEEEEIARKKLVKLCKDIVRDSEDFYE